MSDLTSIPAASTSEIIQTMQTLSDIEGDLADTAMAVASVPASSDDIAEAPLQAGPLASDPSVTMLQSAEAMESVLEQTIPPAPLPAERQDTKEGDMPVDAQSLRTSSENAAASSSDAALSMPAPSLSFGPSDAAPHASAPLDASAELAAGNIDTFNPVLPPDTVAPTYDIVTETAAEEDTSPVRDDVVPATAEIIAKAENNPDDVPAPASTATNPLPSAVVVNVPNQNAPPTMDAVLQHGASAATGAHTNGFSILPPSSEAMDTARAAPIAQTQTPYSPTQAKTEPSLPEGLVSNSPSIIANPDLVRLWRQDPSNSDVVLLLFSWATQKTEINDARAWYQVLAEDNPTATQPLLALINLELALSNFPQVEDLFGKALKGPSGGITAAADVSIWKAYLHYIRRQNPMTDAEQVRGTVTKAYEFALKECGTDRESGEIWQEYISFLAEPSPKNTWETQQQMDNLRKAYQKAVCIPLNNVESLWKAYDAFESGLNKLTAKKFLAERSPAYMTARTALRELRQLTDALPRPVLPPRPNFSDQDRQTVGAWKAYLKWEEGNPLVIADQAVLSARIGYALRKCLGEMRHFPELWHYAANHYSKTGNLDEAAAVLRAGAEACPKSILLNFALAEAEEDRKSLQACHDIFDALIGHLNKEVDELRVVVEAEVNAARGPEIAIPSNGNGNGDADVEMDEGSEVARLVEERESRGKLVAERRGKDVEDVMKAIGVVWVMYMRFARRAEGIKAARAVFGKARKSGNVTWHIFEASAMMEYHSNKDASVAIRIFELGLKLFADEVDYVIRYLQFLLLINDDTNARALFERSALKIPADKSRALWDTWARHEYLYADLGAVQKLEARFAEVFPNDSPLKRFAQRFTYNGIDQIAIRDLGFGRPRPPAAQQQTHLLPQPPAAAISSPPTTKRPPPSPPRRISIDRSRSPPPRSDGAKRYRQQSPPRRFPERDRPLPRGYGRESKERSPMPPPAASMGGSGPLGMARPANLPPPPQVPMPPAPIPASVPVPMSMAAAGHVQQSQPHPRDQTDRSGLMRPLTWFLGQLPSARSFDGPIFRPDDIIGLFGSIDRAGVGIPPPRTGYTEPERRYGGPPPGRRY